MSLTSENPISPAISLLPIWWGLPALSWSTLLRPSRPLCWSSSPVYLMPTRYQYLSDAYNNSSLPSPPQFFPSAPYQDMKGTTIHSEIWDSPQGLFFFTSLNLMSLLEISSNLSFSSSCFYWLFLWLGPSFLTQTPTMTFHMSLFSHYLL